MRKKTRKWSALWLVAVFSVVCSGCSQLSNRTDELLVAPRLSGEFSVIQKALEASINGKYTLKYPSEGDYRSAFILSDLDSDGNPEGVAFYGTSVENTLTMHIAVIDSADGQYRVSCEQSLAAADVEQVQLCDIDGDGVSEILVGWNIYGSVDKKLSVYEYTGSSLIPVIEEPYTAFLTYDMNNDFLPDLLKVNLNLSESTCLAVAYSFSKDGLSVIGTANMDGGISSLGELKLSKLSSGMPFVYVDSVKGSGMLTEVLYYAGEKLHAPFYNAETRETTLTFRPASVPSRDIDGDGNVEFPILQAFPTVPGSEENSTAYITRWSSFDPGTGLTDKQWALMNYNDGYYLNIAPQLCEKITVIRATERRERLFFAYQHDTGETGTLLLSIRTVVNSAWNVGVYAESGYTAALSTDTLTYAVRYTEEGKALGLTPEYIAANLKILKEE